MERSDLPAAIRWQGTGLSDTGLVRTSNQDAFTIDNDLGLWIVADGMGGHAGGSIASQLAVDSVSNRVHASRRSTSSVATQNADAIALLQQAVASGDAAVRHRASADPELAGMGTTLVATLFSPSPHASIAVAHVGDSRAYLIRGRTLQSLTTDHSFVQRLVTENQITPEEAKTHPQQNILLRALGADDRATPDVEIHALDPSDIILLCTDGLTKTLSEDEILSIILETRDSPVTACQQLIDRVNAQGGKDNTTVVLISPRPA